LYTVLARLQDGISASSDSIRFYMGQEDKMENKKTIVDKDY
jgi:hypothetical protein